MITITKEVENYVGEKRQQTERFHLSEKELFDLELSIPGGFTTYIDKISKEENAQELVRLFQEIIDLSYGVLDATGDHFEKTPESLARFKSTVYYSDFYMELATDATKASDFINGIAPKKIRERAAARAEEEKRAQAQLKETLADKPAD